MIKGEGRKIEMDAIDSFGTGLDSGSKRAIPSKQKPPLKINMHWISFLCCLLLYNIHVVGTGGGATHKRIQIWFSKVCH